MAAARASAMRSSSPSGSPAWPATQIDYEMHVSDPKTWTRPWTIRYPLKLDNDYGFYEYACHEGNYSMFNILSGARAAEREAAAGK